MLESYINTAFISLGGVIFFILVGFAILSFYEKEMRAVRVSITLAVLFGSLFVGVSLLSMTVKTWILFTLLGIFLLNLFLFLLPIGKTSFPDVKPQKRIDERDILFARARYQPGSERYIQYYQSHPELKAIDDRSRAEPGLLREGSSFYDRFLFSASSGSFFLTEALREAVDGPVKQPPLSVQPNTVTAYIKALTQYYGALSVGITPLQPYHSYSHIGRGSGVYGDPISMEHKFAIVFTVEMDYDMIGSNPLAPGVMESARQYVEAAKIAICLAATIREMGYEARAHVDGNYRVIAPLVARDAGLGELGRMGLLITPTVGPRVRLGVVTTNLPLIASDRNLDPSVIDFCRICKKCASSCPSQSIPYQDREVQDGVLRWQINGDTCYHYWTHIGTDCGRCMTICPYAHQNNFPHRLIRWGINRSGYFRRIALWMDDLFYGKKPQRREQPNWTRVSKE